MIGSLQFLACAACFGQSDSPMAHGFNWAILSLLAIIVTVLGGFTTFFVFIAKRSAAVSSTPTPTATAAQSPVTDSKSPLTPTH